MLGIRWETEDQPAWNRATAERIQSGGDRWKEGATSGVQLACFVWCSTRIWAYSAEQGCQGRMTSGHTDTQHGSGRGNAEGEKEKRVDSYKTSAFPHINARSLARLTAEPITCCVWDCWWINYIAQDTNRRTL